jgi:hypothetical protein
LSIFRLVNCLLGGYLNVCPKETHMQYLLLIYADPSSPPRSEEEADALFEDFAAWNKDLKASGALIAGNPLAPPSSATTVRARDGKYAITDGPFAETKEYLGGFCIVEAESLDDVLDIAKRCPGNKYAPVEIRPIVPM